MGASQVIGIVVCAAVVSLVAVRDSAVAGMVYYIDLFGHLTGGVDYHLKQDTNNSGTTRHAGKLVHLTYAAVEARLRTLPADIEAHGAISHLPALAENDINPAGYVGLSEWPQIALGAAPQVHTVMREFINSRVSSKAPSKIWSAQQLRDSASAFLASRDRINVASHACQWVDVELWRIILGLEVPLENATNLCDTYMMDFLLRYAVLPDWTRRIPGDPFGFATVRERQLQYVEHFKGSPVVQALSKGDSAKAALMAHVAHDAIALAGGLSVPGLIAKTLHVLHNGSGLSLKAPVVLGVTPQAKLERPDTLRALVLEVARLRPEVTHVAIDYGGEPTLLSLEAALVDPAVWGPDARQLRLDRAVSHDVRTGPYGTAWAHQANADGGPTARGCPGMGLSLALIEGFLRAFIDEWQEWHPEPEGSLRKDHKLGGTLVRRGKGASNGVRDTFEREL